MAKILVMAMALFYAGCATAPSRPNAIEMLNAIQEHRITADQINQVYDDYYKARAEYENSASYKLTMLAVTPLLLLGGAAGAGSTAYAPYTAGGRSYPGRAVINTVPTTGGGSLSTIKYYR